MLVLKTLLATIICTTTYTLTKRFLFKKDFSWKEIAVFSSVFFLLTIILSIT